MKVLKFLLFLILIVLIGGAIYFGAKDGAYDIRQSQTIKAPTSLLFDTVNDYKTWESWSPWKEEDPNMTFSYPEQTSGVGGSYSWDGEFSGSMTTTNLVKNKSIDQDLTLVTPGGERYPNVYWFFEPTENGTTTVTYGMKGEHSFIDKLYYAVSGMDFNADMEALYRKGLQGIETYVNKAMSVYTISESKITEYGGGFYVYKTSSASSNNISAIMGQNYSEIMSFLTQNNITPSGMPFTIYNEMSANGVVMSNAIPVREKIAIAGDTNILSGYTSTTKAVKTTLKGDYTHLSQAWEKAQEYLTQYNLEASNLKPFEIYTNDPGNYPNPADWTTDLYIPIK
jgi:effector-binding domain-containing protein/ribosome-associated toxin RatA of RatAB toxin-antitoxin module